MTDKVNLPIRKFLEQKISDNFKDVDFRRGTAFNDLWAKPAAMILQPFRHELNMLKINQSILNFDNMATSDVDLLIGNIFIRRASATKAMGTVRIYFNNPGIYNFTRLIFSTQSGLNFINLSVINTTVNSLLLNRSDEGLYFIDVAVEAENAGSQYSVKSGEIQLIQNQPAQIVKVENIDDFGMVDDTENNAQLYAKARRSIAVRNLINDSSIQSVLFNEFSFLRDVFVVGAGDAEMIRDLITIPTVPPAKVHIGGMTDVYIDTTGITASELNINSIPENGIIDCVGSAQQTLLFQYNSGVLDETFFFDFNNVFIENGTPLVTRGNKLTVTSLEFSQAVSKTYNIEQVLSDNRVRISGGIKSTILDGVVFEVGNIIYDFVQGAFKNTYEVVPGDYFSYGPGDAWKLNNVSDSNVELKPHDITILDLVFNNEIPFDGTSSFINFPGIGGVLATPTEVKINDVLSMTTSNAWGRYNIIERINDDTLLIFPESATVATASVQFNGTNQFVGVIPVGTYVTVRDNAAVTDGQTLLVIAANTFDRAHGEGVATLACYTSDKIIQETISLNTPFNIFRKRIKEVVVTTPADQLVSPIAPGDYFFETANTAQYKMGDEVFFDGSTRTIIGIQVGATNKYQLDGVGSVVGQIAGFTPTLYRFSVDQFTTSTVIFNRYTHTGKFLADVAGGFTTINQEFVGVNAWSGYKLIIHTGNATGIYTIAASVMNPNSITVTAPIANGISAGDEYSIVVGIAQAGSAQDDILYVPSFGNDLSLVSGTFPNSAVTHFVQIVNGLNKGVYEVAEYIDPNRVRINGTLSVTGENVVVKAAFATFTASGSTTIVEPGTPFVGVTQYDTLIIDRAGQLSYHSVVSNTGNNTLVIYPALTDDVVGGNTQYSIVHDTMNPFVITTSQISAEIHNVPEFFDRRTEGYHAHCVGNTFLFTDNDANFLDVFSGVNPAGYEIYILSGTHARTAPYIISSISTPTTLVISAASEDDSTSDTPNFSSATGFIGTSSPSNSEQYEIKKQTNLLSPVNYSISEDYSYYNGEYFKLPILALRDITLINATTGELESIPLNEPADYILSVKDATTRYSVIERPIIKFTDPDAYKYRQVRIRYYSDPNVKVVHDFCVDKANRITNNSLLVKRMESTFIEVTISVEGNIDVQTAQDTINEYITTRKSLEPIEASDMIQKLYEIGVTYVDTDSLLITSIYYASDGTRFDSSSRTRVVSASTATYIPGAITINLTPTT